jgi:hypothetical protein
MWQSFKHASVGGDPAQLGSAAGPPSGAPLASSARSCPPHAETSAKIAASSATGAPRRLAHPGTPRRAARCAPRHHGIAIAARCEHASASPLRNSRQSEASRAIPQPPKLNCEPGPPCGAQAASRKARAAPGGRAPHKGALAARSAANRPSCAHAGASTRAASCAGGARFAREFGAERLSTRANDSLAAPARSGSQLKSSSSAAPVRRADK